MTAADAREPSLCLEPATHACGTVVLPGSKSISNRALLLAALADGFTELDGLLDSDDTQVMRTALQALGLDLRQTGADRVRLGGAARWPQQQADLFLGNAGTAFRPLTAVLAMMGGNYRLSGVPRMHERPIGDLVDALRGLGCAIAYEGQQGYPPLRIGPGHLDARQPVRVRGSVSSQFLTALLMAAPVAAHRTGCDVVIELDGPLISRPYIQITLNLMERFGVPVRREGWERFIIPADARYRAPGRYRVEGDASSASYFLGLGAIAGGPIRIEGVGGDSIQGDVAFAEVVEAMGAQVKREADALVVQGCRVARGERLRAFDRDFNLIPDAAMTAAVLALYADGPCRLRNIASWRVKETDRIDAMHAELTRLGARVESDADSLTVYPLPAHDWRAAEIRTYDDHRMAMCFSLAAFGPVPVTILDPGCVSKTYPDYFTDFRRLLGTDAGASPSAPVITIDGPTASGKGTIAQRVAHALGWRVLDSGALYRLTALAVLREGGDGTDEAQAARLARRLDVRFEPDAIFLDGEDVGTLIRQEAVGNLASRVAAWPAVREALLARQRDFRRMPGLVADGRDMGTVVFPDAPLKIFLDADVEVRAQRRHKQLKDKGFSANLSDLLNDLKARDARDRGRAHAPLVAAADAVTVDSSHQGIDDVVRQVLDLWSARGPA
ncbi:MAG: bifunctional 3-phosphoshikimate 1-carboxyvinyltransferase/cytidylate kinase [Castellaniella sp.]|uniref:bifunctional 3-phosphoshikimate 1-carboxyvinyltransferase/cytidylate kinase n=1 Tax=Castellaniella sp. TaxID=1955812 RepID=UPI002A371AC7|nr:bifunctional 3-phosphoshikimate 1-carboxyvinyltransferase/cytidylate kinase [Castellaniella sp.]MDY0308838.1 bifunctional 3-phosphoshikimate 1-carboxyvinyltransferase/cytidylate kinase [Castellaniella sp.]